MINDIKNNSSVNVPIVSLAKYCFIFYIYLDILNVPHFLLVALNLNPIVYSVIQLCPIVLILFGVYFIIPKSKGHKNSKINLWLIAFFSYLLIGTFSLLVSDEIIPNQTDTFRSFARVAFEVIFFYYFLLSLNKGESKRLLVHITIAYFILGLSIPGLAFFGISLSDGVTGLETVIDTGRPAGLAANANPAAFQGTIGVILIIFWLLSKPNNAFKLILSLALIIQIGCTVFTFSNTGMISISMVVVFSLLKISFLNSGIYKFLGFVLILAFISLKFINFSLTDDLSITNYKKLENFVKIITLDDNIKFSKRDTKLADGLSKYLESPIIGHGIGYFKRKMSVHNTFLVVLGDSGVIPFFFFTFLLGLLFTHGALSVHSNLSFLYMSSVFVFGLFCLTLQNMLDPLQYHFYFMFLLKDRNHFTDI